MITLWYLRMIGTLAASACDALSLLGILTQMTPIVSGYYAVTMVDYAQGKGGILGRVFYTFKRGRSRR